MYSAVLVVQTQTTCRNKLKAICRMSSYRLSLNHHTSFLSGYLNFVRTSFFFSRRNLILSIISSIHAVMIQYVKGSLKNIAPVYCQKWHCVLMCSQRLSDFKVSNIKEQFIKLLMILNWKMIFETFCFVCIYFHISIIFLYLNLLISWNGHFCIKVCLCKTLSDFNKICFPQ